MCVCVCVCVCVCGLFFPVSGLQESRKSGLYIFVFGPVRARSSVKVCVCVCVLFYFYFFISLSSVRVCRTWTHRPVVSSKMESTCTVWWLQARRACWWMCCYTRWTLICQSGINTLISSGWYSGGFHFNLTCCLTSLLSASFRPTCPSCVLLIRDVLKLWIYFMGGRVKLETPIMADMFLTEQ